MENLKMEKLFGLDIGTRSIVGSVGYKKKNGEFVVEAMCIKEHETRAMVDGQIHDIESVVKTIIAVKKELESKVGYELKKVCIAAAGRVLKTIVVHDEKKFYEERVIKEENVYNLTVDAASKAAIEMKKNSEKEEKSFYLVGYTPMQYYINGYPMSKLEGHKSKSIEVDILATFLPEEVIDDLYTAVEKSGLEVENLTLEPIAAIDVAIPEKYRLLNIALVDIGAGTSDISITKDGGIVAYGMIPCAGDEITEFISKKYLIEFKDAEKIKVMAEKSEKIEYTDIMGIKHIITQNEFFKDVEEGCSYVADKIANKIIELNGGKSTSAVFVVGGGGKVKGFVDILANYLKLPKERVALRGKEVLENVEILENKIKKDSILVTPIGIILNYYEKHNNFVQLNVNGKNVKIFDNNHLTVIDIALHMGLTNKDLFSTNGKSLKFTLNNSFMRIKGSFGKSADIVINDKVADLQTSVKNGDTIRLKKAVAGVMAKKRISELREFNRKMNIIIDNKKIEIDRNIMVNGKEELADYEIKNGDNIEINDYCTVSQLKRYIECDEHMIIMTENNIRLFDDDFVHENERIILKNDYEVFDYENDYIKKSLTGDEIGYYEKEKTSKVSTSLEKTKENNQNSKKKKVIKGNKINIMVNGENVTLSDKSSYIFVDILEVYPFDTSAVGGDKLVMNVNEERAEFTTSIKDQDVVELYWV